MPARYVTDRLEERDSALVDRWRGYEMTETIAREKAMTTLAKYGLTLCESWSGYAEVMHAYHAPNLSYWITWEEYLERIDTVQRTKLCNEIPVRLAAMQPVIQY